jgi:hypothetical protein
MHHSDTHAWHAHPFLHFILFYSFPGKIRLADAYCDSSVANASLTHLSER